MKNKTVSEQLIIAYKELEEKEFFLRESQRVAQIGSYILNFVTQYWQSSETLDDIFGIDKSYIRNIEGWKEIVHPDDQNKLDEYLRSEVLGKQKSFDKEYRIVRIDDKQIRWVYGLGEVKFDDSGNAIQLIGTIQDITERKKKEQKLFDSNQMLSQSQKLTQMGSWELNPETGIISWSDEMYNIYNCDPETFTPNFESFINLLHPEDRELLINWTGKVITGIKQNAIVFRLNTNEGTIKYIRGEGEFVLNKAGKVIRLFGTAQDITERIESEEKMFQLSSIINATSDFVAIASSADHHITFMNKAARDALGFGKEEDVSQTQISDYHSAWANELLLKEAIPAVMKTGSWTGETAILTKTGVEIPISQVIILHSDENGNPQFLGTIARDITESKKVNDNLKLSEVRFRAFFENSPLALFVFDVNSSKFVRVNLATEKLFNLTKKKLTSVGPGHLSPEYQPDGIKSKEKIKEILARTLDGENLSFEWVYITSDGSEIITETKLSLLPSDGSPLILASSLNITERRKDEIKLEQKNKELQKTNNELDRFVYSVSHELRAPLKSMLGLADIISYAIEPDNKEQLERLKMMKQSVIKLDNFIEDILHYSRNSRMEVIKEEIYFEEAINSIWVSHQFMQDTKRLKLKLEIKQTDKCISDKRRVNVILSNLLSNAIKYQDVTKENSFVKIMVQCSKENVILSVEDNGIGIAENNHKKIFEMFYRATTLSSGSGLGMYILKETIEKIGGTIELESKLGIGSKFTITIPV